MTVCATVCYRVEGRVLQGGVAQKTAMIPTGCSCATPYYTNFILLHERTKMDVM